MNPLDSRRSNGAAWAASCLQSTAVTLQPVSGDASFRRYFRLSHNDQSLILMDAPPDKEDSRPFIDIASRLRTAGLNAPQILEFDLEQGYGLLEDFGDTLYRELITTDSVDVLFVELFDVLVSMANKVETAGMPAYDAERLQTELDLFTDWYLARHKRQSLDRGEQALWRSVCDKLIQSALGQPQVFVHRDFHSANLLATNNGPGIIDFQDAVHGPISYDLASLIWDRYIHWSREQLVDWMTELHTRLELDCSRSEWIRQCDWMGLQRNLKIVGIFARLRYRDDKRGYLQMIPAFYQYLLDVLAIYPEFDEFRIILESDKCAP